MMPWVVHLIDRRAVIPKSRRWGRCTHLCTSKRYDSKADELVLGTDAVDVVVKATVARAGQIAAATENRIAEPAPSTAETSAGSSLFRSSEERNTMSKARPVNRKNTPNKSFGAPWKRAATKALL